MPKTTCKVIYVSAQRIVKFKKLKNFKLNKNKKLLGQAS